ncbi:hypothetical protein D9758_015808 [Tetrapyrgos nigripes]|uniref:FAD/NAD(P)-binding domain-containing protein n=1 Tax=Tetrapyrgos nigripes TaxID=182062 RepID=A0A8H5FC95_9AGAR|nr:hypothetical protein D9758_015808 [Tetrapyrgos nigripes]
MPIIEDGSAENYDVIVIGGGVAGCSTALSLTRKKPDAVVLVLDNANVSSFKVGIALPEEAQQVLSYLAPQYPLELLQDLSESESIPLLSRSSGNACSWSGPDLRENRAQKDGSGIGWHLDRAQFDEILRDVVIGSTESQKAPSLSRGTFIGIEKVDEGRLWSISVQDSESKEVTVYTSKWVVDASGREATVARMLGARTVQFDTLTAFHALFMQIPNALSTDPDHRSIIEASENGWWFTAPTPSRVRVVIYYTDKSNPTARAAQTQSGFLKLLFRGTVHIARLLTKYQYAIVPGTTADNTSNSTVDKSKSKKPAIYQIPAGSTHLTPCCNQRNGEDGDGARWCAVGDAAMAIDPLASQGILNAMKLGSCVGDAIARELLLRPEGGTTGADQPVAPDPTAEVPAVMAQMRYNCEVEKLESYRQAVGFQGEFWLRRR